MYIFIDLPIHTLHTIIHLYIHIPDLRSIVIRDSECGNLVHWSKVYIHPLINWLLCIFLCKLGTFFNPVHLCNANNTSPNLDPMHSSTLYIYICPQNIANKIYVVFGCNLVEDGQEKMSWWWRTKGISFLLKIKLMELVLQFSYIMGNWLFLRNKGYTGIIPQGTKWILTVLFWSIHKTKQYKWKNKKNEHWRST